MTVITIDYEDLVRKALPYCLTATNLPLGSKYQGKVRDTYDIDDKLIIVTTDRVSAFDRVLSAVPYKGQVLNLISSWWFEQTKTIIPNHLIRVPDPAVTIAKKCKVFPIEFVMRGYITGTTNTSLWTQYNSGVRNYCGNPLPEGLVKNQRLQKPMLTPTTKEAQDRPISPDEIIREGWMSAYDWEVAATAAQQLFEFGIKTAAQQNLILVDTKYEFGKDADGNIMLVDEIHTPDSSRYWLADTYETLFAEGKEPENIDKEFLRLWFKDNCDPYKDTDLPEAPVDLRVRLALRYIQLFEKISGRKFNFPQKLTTAEERIARNVAGYLM